MGTILNYIFMAFAAFFGIIILTMFRDYKQCLLLWTADIVITFFLWYSFGMSIPYALFLVAFATLVINPFKPMEGTFTAKDEEKKKLEAAKYLKDHPIGCMSEYDRQAMTISRWIK